MRTPFSSYFAPGGLSKFPSGQAYQSTTGINVTLNVMGLIFLPIFLGLFIHRLARSGDQYLSNGWQVAEMILLVLVEVDLVAATVICIVAKISVGAAFGM